MKTLMKSKRAIAPLFLILFSVFFLITIYIGLFIPIPAFTKLRMMINYFLILIVWFIIQAGLVYGYYRIGSFVVNGLLQFKSKIMKFSSRIEKYILSSA